jgi:hypothetical protein
MLCTYYVMYLLCYVPTMLCTYYVMYLLCYVPTMLCTYYVMYLLCYVSRLHLLNSKTIHSKTTFLGSHFTSFFLQNTVSLYWHLHRLSKIQVKIKKLKYFFITFIEAPVIPRTTQEFYSVYFCLFKIYNVCVYSTFCLICCYNFSCTFSIVCIYFVCIYFICIYFVCIYFICIC